MLSHILVVFTAMSMMGVNAGSPMWTKHFLSHVRESRKLQGSDVDFGNMDVGQMFCDEFQASSDDVVLGGPVTCEKCDTDTPVCRIELETSCLDNDQSGVCYKPEIDEAFILGDDGNAIVETDLLIRYQGDLIGLEIGVSIRDSELNDEETCAFFYEDQVCDCNPECSTGGEFGGISIDCEVLPENASGINNKCYQFVSDDPFGFPPTLIQAFAGLHVNVDGGIIDPNHNADNANDGDSKFPNCERDFSEELEEYNPTALECPICNTGQTVCNARLAEQCLSSSADSLCFTGSVHEEVFMSSTNINLDFEYGLVYSGGNTQLLFVEKVQDAADKGCQFYWNGNECDVCTQACALPGETDLNGMAFDCSNLNPDAKVDCARVEDNEWLPREAIEKFAVFTPPSNFGDSVIDHGLDDDGEETLDCEGLFQEDISENMKKKIDTLTCETCDESRSLCTATTEEECLPNDLSVCYITQITEDFSFEGALSVGLDMTVSFSGEGSNSIRYVQKVEEEFVTQNEQCDFYWNDRKCRSCTPECSDKQTSKIGVGVDCSNIEADVIVDCAPYDEDSEFFPVALIEAFAFESKPMFKEICDDFVQSMDSGACSVCTDEMVVCQQTVPDPEQCVDTMEAAGGDRICYTLATGISVNMEEGWIEEVETLDYTAGTTRQAKLTIRASFSEEDLFDSEFQACSFVVDQQLCQCQACDAQGDSVTIDCSNLFPGNVVSSCIEDVGEVLTKLPLTAAGTGGGGSDDKDWVAVVVPFFLLMAIAVMVAACALSPATRRERNTASSGEGSAASTDVQASDAVMS